jgi:regulator of nucleoside diphosphate kinase
MDANLSEAFSMDTSMNKIQPPITVSSLDLQRIEALLESDSYKNLPGIAALEAELHRANIVEPNEVPPGLITMNSKVRFIDEATDGEYGLTLVYPNSNNPPGAVSILAPVGSALLGLSVGQSIAWQVPGGRELRLRVLEVIYQPEASGEYHR